VAHLRPFRLPGGDAAVHEPRRVALALLWEVYGDSAFEREDLAPVRAFRPAERDLLGRMLKSGVNSPITTSAGRLFDGVASLMDMGQRVSFEGQAAMSLEFTADAAERGAYPISLEAVGGENGSGAQHSGGSSALAHSPSLVLNWGPLIEALLSDLQRGVPPGIMAARFHNSLAAAIVDVATLIGEHRVALTGGCFQNRMLVERSADRLCEAGFEVLLHRVVPPNDGGISLGQVAVASVRLTTMAGG
jgi:hydrogenase maturation protein HypF